MQRSSRRRGAVWCFCLGLAVAGRPAMAAGLEAELGARWQGAWVLIGVNTYSACSSFYTNNEVRGDLVVSKGDLAFEPGELGLVHKLDLGRKRLDVLIDLAEPVLLPRPDGPFVLYEEASCKVELQVPRPAADGVDALDRLLGELLERHASVDSARASPVWNHRQRAAYPENYEETLARHARWKVRQVNAAVLAKIDESVEEGARLADHLDDEPQYLEGFAEGVDRARDRYLSSDCEQLLQAAPYSFAEQAPRDQTDDWRDGFEDGQKLVFHLEVAHRLFDCFLPEPDDAP